VAHQVGQETSSGAGEIGIPVQAGVRRSATLVTILYGGRHFTASREMARIFLRRARQVIESGESQLVPLRHVDGIELVLVSRLTPYSLADPAGD
jgi:hypothetical protein